MRIASLGISFDGSVKLAPGGGFAFSGCGHLVYGDGDSYIGEFLCGKRHGWGQIVRADGSKVRCHWANDLPVVEDDPNFLPSEQQRLALLERNLCEWVSRILAAASVSPLSCDEMRSCADKCDVSPPPAPASTSDAELMTGKAAREAELLLIQSMTSEIVSLRKHAVDSQLLSHSIETQRSELAAVNMQLQHAVAMQTSLQSSLSATDQRMQAALASLHEAQVREQKLLAELSNSVAESNSYKAQLLQQQQSLEVAQRAVSDHMSQVCSVF
jgi:hypothetical protein